MASKLVRASFIPGQGHTLRLYHVLMDKTIVLTENHNTSPVQYRLSGVAYLNAAREKFEVLFDGGPAKSICINVCTLDDIDRIRLGPSNFQSEYRIYLIHVHCWNIIKRIIGPLAEERLELLVMALRERSTGYPDVYGINIGLSCWQLHRSWMIAGTKTGEKLQREHMIEILADPFSVPTLNNVVDRCKKRHTRTRIFPQLSSKLRPTYLANLPSEIRMLILDELPDPMDAMKATIAFYWELPNVYWKSRHTTKMIFEADGLSVDDLDWQSLFFVFAHMLKLSSALSNRKRIFGVLEGTRDLFFDMLKKKSSV